MYASIVFAYSRIMSAATIRTVYSLPRAYGGRSRYLVIKMSLYLTADCLLGNKWESWRHLRQKSTSPKSILFLPKMKHWSGPLNRLPKSPRKWTVQSRFSMLDLRGGM